MPVRLAQALSRSAACAPGAMTGRRETSTCEKTEWGERPRLSLGRSLLAAQRMAATLRPRVKLHDSVSITAARTPEPAAGSFSGVLSGGPEINATAHRAFPSGRASRAANSWRLLRSEVAGSGNCSHGMPRVIG